MEENVKTSKFNISKLLPKLLPALAVGVAALSLLFTFLIGVSVSGAESSTEYFYHYFGDVGLIASASGAAQAVIRTQVLFGLLFSLFALIIVLVFAGLTCYRAVLKYVYKKEADVEKFAVITYFCYVIFAAVNYAINAVLVTSDGATASVGYGAATVVGLTCTTVVMGAYFACKILSNLDRLKVKAKLIDVIYSLARAAVMIVIIALLTLPIIGITVEGQTITANFIGLSVFGIASSLEEKLMSLVTSSAFGFLIETAIIIFYSVLLVKMFLSLFGAKNKKDAVLYVIGAFLSAVLILFSFLAGSLFTDVIQAEAAPTLAIPIAVFVLAVVAAVLAVLYPVVLNATADKTVIDDEHDPDENVLLEVKNLSKYFVLDSDFYGRPTKTLKAVDGVSFKVKKGTTLGIVGESGCGKTTLGRTILRLYDVTKGDVWFKGNKVSEISNREFDKLRPDMQMIFQDPYASLSPRITVGEIIGEAAKQHKIVSKSEYHDYVLSVMKMCGLQPHYFERYPHEFSGGQRQRICIARALALKPELVVCDEPVSALDVSIQAQIINMLIELRKTLGLTYIFISHDLSVVKHISDEVGVMYLGTMMEYGSKQAIFNNTLHPYTRALFSAVPVPNPHVKMNRVILKGDIPSPVNPPKGCKFHTRCESCMAVCSELAPIYKEVEPGHFCACHLYSTDEEIAELRKKAEEERQHLEEEAAKKKKWRIDIKAILAKFKRKPAENEESAPAEGAQQTETVKAEAEVEDAAEE